MKKQHKQEQKQDPRKDEKQNAKSGPSNAKVEERAPKDERLSSKHQQQTEKQAQKKIREKESRKEERKKAVPGPSNANVAERKEKVEREVMEDGLSWIVWDFDLACLDDFEILIPDLKSSLDPSQQEQFNKDFAALENDKKNTEKLKSFDQNRDDEGPQRKKMKKNKEKM